MLVDVEQFPIIWMRAEQAHSHDEDDVASETKLMRDTLARNERFVMIADGLPRLEDVAEIRKGGREKAIMFKTHGKDFKRLCAAMILIGKAAALPAPIRKSLEGITSAFGIALLFVNDKQTALDVAQERLAGAPPEL